MTISALASPRVAGVPANLRQLARTAGEPFPVSLRAFLTERPFSKTVRLQVVNVEPSPSFTLVRVVTASLITQLLRMRQVYAFADIGVDLVATTTWSGDEALGLTDLDTGVGRLTNPEPCDATMTAEQTQLYAHRDGMEPNDVAIYRVRSVLPSFAGCAAHPDGVPGAAIGDSASQWTLAHEVGHILGLPHVNTSGPCFLTRLMTRCGTWKIAGVPTLARSEIDTMRGSPFLIDTPR